MSDGTVVPDLYAVTVLFDPKEGTRLRAVTNHIHTSLERVIDGARKVAVLFPGRFHTDGTGVSVAFFENNKGIAAPFGILAYEFEVSDKKSRHPEIFTRTWNAQRGEWKEQWHDPEEEQKYLSSLTGDPPAT
jgi:hypothetical protein